MVFCQKISFLWHFFVSQTGCFIVYMAIHEKLDFISLGSYVWSVKIRILESIAVLNLASRPRYLESRVSVCGSSNSCSNLRMLSVNSFRGLSDPLILTGRSSGWGGSYATGQNSSFRVNQHISASSSISDRKTLQTKI